MKKPISLTLVIFILLCLCACSSSDSEKTDDTKSATEVTAATEATEATETMDPSTLLAGFGRVSCIPDDPLVHIAGGTAADDPATDGLLDTLDITCVALQKAGETYLIYTCDIVDIIGFNSNIEATIEQELGIPKENVIFNGTHTHSAPTLKPGDINLPGTANYAIKFHSCGVEAAHAATEDLSPVSELSYGSIMTEDMVRVRHYLMKAGNPPSPKNCSKPQTEDGLPVLGFMQRPGSDLLLILI